MEKLLLALMTFASAHTGLPVPERLPNIVKMERCDLQAFYQPQAPCDDNFAAQAVYAHGTIYLPDTWSSDDLYHVSMLLHESLHHMQFEAGVEPEPCAREAYERPAYDLQIAFLEAAGVDPYKTMGVNALAVFFLTTCKQEYGGM